MVTCSARVGPAGAMPMERRFWAARDLCVCMARRQASSWNLVIMMCDAALSTPAGALEETRRAANRGE